MEGGGAGAPSSPEESGGGGERHVVTSSYLDNTNFVDLLLTLEDNVPSGSVAVVAHHPKSNLDWISLFPSGLCWR